MFKFQHQGGKKPKSEKNSGLQNRAIRGLQIGARGIINRGSFRDFKSGQKDYKSGQGFQIGGEITNRGKKDFNSGQGLQIGAGNRNRCRTTCIGSAPGIIFFLDESMDKVFQECQDFIKREKF